MFCIFKKIANHRVANFGGVVIDDRPMLFQGGFWNPPWNLEFLGTLEFPWRKFHRLLKQEQLSGILYCLQASSILCDARWNFLWLILSVAMHLLERKSFPLYVFANSALTWNFLKNTNPLMFPWIRKMPFWESCCKLFAHDGKIFQWKSQNCF